jgi:hypothetical protein
MSEKPDGIVLQRARDLVGREGDIWVRRDLFALVPQGFRKREAAFPQPRRGA